MERAKQKIKSQAAQILFLEAKLEKAVSFRSSKGESDDKKQESTKKIMSPQERLEAHIERKRLENKYKEDAGKWDAPSSPVKRENLVSKVKRKDHLVNRLVAEPKQRRRQSEIDKRLRRSQKKYEVSASDEDDSGTDREELLSSRRSLDSKTNKTKSNNRKNGAIPKGLMDRLNMSVKERRACDEKSDLITDNLKRTLRGHKIHTKSWRMSQEFDHEMGGSSDIDEKQSPKCETCSSKDDCEEDVDNPGIYYCQNCWEEYEHNQILDKRDQRSTNRNHNSTREVNSSGKKSRHLRNKKYDDALWIIHDNPKLGSRLTWSGSKKMECLIETKDTSKKNSVKILIGKIDYCGPVLESGTMNKAATARTDRGAECIRISNIDGYTVDHDKVETRLAKNKSIYEFQLDPKDAIKLTGINAEMRLQDFYHGCKGAVDVILSPQCSPGGWFPQREASLNSRKIAPQFRSNGVGYIRLGDDMGNNGLAFLSCDSCNTFLSEEGGVEYFENDESNISSSFAHNYRKSTKNEPTRRPKVNNKQMMRKIVDEDESDFESFSVTSLEDEGNDNTNKAAALLKELQNYEVAKDVKWKEKAEVLLSLGKEIGKPSGRASCSNSLTYIQDVISSKNVNINVLRNAIYVIEMIGNAMKYELVYHVSWKTILIEMLKLLKNKQVGTRAKDVLKKLHGTCFTLGNSMVAVTHVLGMGKVSIDHRRSSGSIKQLQSEERQASMQKSNSVEVIKWLALTTESERIMEYVNPLLDDSGLNQLASIFLSHESHRDESCRKNALDGMLHTILYGVQRLNMEKSNALKLFLDIKTKNPRSWSRLTKSVNLAMRAEMGNGKEHRR